MKWIFMSLLLGGWGFYIFLGESPQTRIYRACTPVDGIFQGATFVTSKWNANAAEVVSRWGIYSVQWCQYGLNRTFYEAPVK